MKKRNAVIGWLTLRIARRRIEKMLDALVEAPKRRRRRRRLLAGLGLGLTAVGAATTTAFVVRRERGKPTSAPA